MVDVIDFPHDEDGIYCPEEGSWWIVTERGEAFAGPYATRAHAQAARLMYESLQATWLDVAQVVRVDGEDAQNGRMARDESSADGS